MRTFEHTYVAGSFLEPHGSELMPLVDPTTGDAPTRVRLADDVDARRAVQAAAAALPAWSETSVADRASALRRLHEAVAARAEEHVAAAVEEYGGPITATRWRVDLAPRAFLDAAALAEQYAFTRRIGASEVTMLPVGVVAAITPWNNDIGFLCGKLAPALAAGCTVVIKPSELSARQTQLVAECVHAAALPPGVVNIVTGRGATAGAALVADPDVAKITFTGSTAVGKGILRGAADTLKRVTLELGGKSPTILLDDADLAAEIPRALAIAFMNNGQACIAGTRLLVHERQLAEVLERVRSAVEAMIVGDPRDPATTIGPLVTHAQYERVQRYIARGLEEGATLVTGGPGPARPRGFFARPTVFAHVTNAMTIAREEIFGPVLSILSYRDDADAISIAND
ncbi:MAG TPA: aldehyde dehydrogenase family protein, partial [Kofleriaceae bacterium]|nr:aldehyde dehydrogenase family protein [Kofleriaceae bacterium]